MGRDQRRRRAGRGDHQHRHGPHRVRRSAPRGHRAREVRHRQAGQRRADRGDQSRAGRDLRGGGRCDSARARPRLRHRQQLAGGGRTSPRPAHADHDLPGRVRPAARRPSRRQCRDRAGRRRDVLRRTVVGGGRQRRIRTGLDARSIRGARAPTVDDRRRCAQSCRRRLLRAGVLRRLRSRGQAPLDRRFAARADRAARRPARR